MNNLKKPTSNEERLKITRQTWCFTQLFSCLNAFWHTVYHFMKLWKICKKDRLK